MSPLELTSTITAIANALACRLTSDEAVLLSTVLVQLGDTLATITAVKTAEENICSRSEKRKQCSLC